MKAQRRKSEIMKKILLVQYREYVGWCNRQGTHPIGFINWKAQKAGCVWDSKKHEYVKIATKQQPAPEKVRL